MSKPDPEQFARVVLWHLAGLRAEIAEISGRLARLEAFHLGAPSDEQDGKRREATKHLTDKTYLEALKVAGIEPQPPSPPTDDPRNA